MNIQVIRTVYKNETEKGDLVYITDDDNPFLSWPLGIVENVYAGNDSPVRVVQVKKGNWKLGTRPILRFQKLPLKDDERLKQYILETNRSKTKFKNNGQSSNSSSSFFLTHLSEIFYNDVLYSFS